MLPINIDMKQFMSKAMKENDRLEKEEKQNRTSCSQQSLVNQLVSAGMPNNPNAGTIQQSPAKQ